MGCWPMSRPLTAEEQEARRKRAEALELGLQQQKLKVRISAMGAVAFEGRTDEDRKGLSDACGYRTLASQGSWALRQALARAEALAGRKVDERVVAAGTHSHDGGQTWQGGH